MIKVDVISLKSWNSNCFHCSEHCFFILFEEGSDKNNA